MVKYINKVPNIIGINVTLKDRNYFLRVQLKCAGQQLNVEIELPKNNNIFRGKYETIWPTIKYLFRKKLMQFPLFNKN